MRTLPNYEISLNLILKPNDITRKRNLQNITLHENRCKIYKQHFNQLNPTIYKNNTSWSSGVYPRMHNLFNISKSHHINKVHVKNHVFICTYTEKAFSKFQHLFLIKTPLTSAFCWLFLTPMALEPLFAFSYICLPDLHCFQKCHHLFYNLS